MAKLQLVAGTTSKLLHIFVQNSSVTTGAGLTGLTSASSGLTAYYLLEGAASTAVISLSAGTLGTWSSGGFVEADATHMPGVYELGIPNAALTGAKSCVVYLFGATNMAPVVLEIELTATNNQDGVHFGITALPNAAAGASTGLIINGTNAGALTESYAALNAAPTINQLLYEVRALLAQVSVSGTTLTTQKIDGITTAETFTLNSATAPTSITRAS